MRKIISLLLTAALLTAILSSCSSGPANYIGLLFDNSSDAFAKSISETIQEEIKNKDNGYNAGIMLNDGKNTQSIQDDQLKVITTQPVKALMINLIDAGSVKSVLDQASKANMPAVLFDNEPDLSVVKSYEKAVFVGASDLELGKAQGEMAAKLWKDNGKYDRNGDGVIQYIVIGGGADDNKSDSRTQGAIDSIKAAGLKAEQLGVQAADWDKSKAQQTADSMIKDMGDKIELIICGSDDMAAGVIAALQSAGYNKDADKRIPVVGIGAEDEAKELISKGYMDGTVGNDPVEMGKVLIKLAMNLATGKEALDGTDYKFDDSGVAVRIACKVYTGETISKAESSSEAN